MKKKLDAILVVEGKSDVAFLSNYLDCEFVTTNGSDVPSSVIEYLKSVKDKKIIVLTDPDTPGKMIRDKLDENIPNLEHAFINKEHAIKHGKVGVAEADIDEVLEALNHRFVSSSKEPGNVTMTDLMKLGLTGSPDSKEKRELVGKKLFLGYACAKTLLKRINSNNISIEDLERALSNE